MVDATTGGPAFPVLLPDPDFPATPGYGQACKQHPGMTLRAAFAIGAMQNVHHSLAGWRPGDDSSYDRVALHCWRLADAMLRTEHRDTNEADGGCNG